MLFKRDSFKSGTEKNTIYSRCMKNAIFLRGILFCICSTNITNYLKLYVCQHFADVLLERNQFIATKIQLKLLDDKQFNCISFNICKLNLYIIKFTYNFIYVGIFNRNSTKCQFYKTVSFNLEHTMKLFPKFPLEKNNVYILHIINNFHKLYV